MSYYRLYYLSEDSATIIGHADFHASDDGRAIIVAREHAGRHPLELWCGRRKVLSMPLEASASPSLRTS